MGIPTPGAGRSRTIFAAEAEQFLGAVAIELASGKPLFDDDDVRNVLRGHAERSPPTLHDYRAELPSELSDLIEWLLVKEPEAHGRPTEKPALQFATAARLGRRFWLVTGFAAGPDGAIIEIAGQFERAAPISRTVAEVAGQPLEVTMTFLGALPN